MVSTTIPDKSALPDGRYRLVGWDVDSTGQMVTDEICHLAAFSAEENFSQYIMPYKDLTKFAQRRYMIFTRNVGRYRVLQDKTNSQIIRTKSEISALLDFLIWLEKVKNQDPNCSGIILLCHDAFELAPLLLIQALKRYDLYDRFSIIVKGFANCYAFVKLKCESSVTSFSLRTLSKILLDQDDEQTFSAKNRSRIAYQLVQHLRAGLADSNSSVVSWKELGELSGFVTSLADKEASLPGKLQLAKRQSTLQPLFRAAMRNSSSSSGQQRLHERKQAAKLRNQLAEANIDYETLQRTWTEGNKEKLSSLLENALSSESCSCNETDRQQLVQMAVEHFENPPPTAAAGVARRRKHRKSATETPNSSVSLSPSSLSLSPSSSNKSDLTPQSTPSTVVQSPPINSLSSTPSIVE